MKTNATAARETNQKPEKKAERKPGMETDRATDMKMVMAKAKADGNASETTGRKAARAAEKNTWRVDPGSLLLRIPKAPGPPGALGLQGKWWWWWWGGAPSAPPRGEQRETKIYRRMFGGL